MMCTSTCILVLTVLLPSLLEQATAAKQSGPDNYARMISAVTNFRQFQNGAGCATCKLASRHPRGTIVYQSAFKGFKAAKFLLDDAKPVPKVDKLLREEVNEYLKPGGYVRAYNEFRILEPSDLREYGPAGYKTMMGNVGDRVLILNERGFADLPSLEIIKDQSGRDINIIYYTDSFP